VPSLGSFLLSFVRFRLNKLAHYLQFKCKQITDEPNFSRMANACEKQIKYYLYELSKLIEKNAGFIGVIMYNNEDKNS
jgi:hypothetical protein